MDVSVFRFNSICCCYVNTFNGKYLRYEDEEKKKAKKEAKKQKLIAEMQQNGGYGAVDEGMNGMN